MWGIIMDRNPVRFIKNLIHRILRSRLFIKAVGLITVYTLAGFFLAPYMIRYTLAEYSADVLKRDLTLGRVNVNPFIFTLDLQDLKLADKDRAAMLGFDRVFIDFEVKSLFLRAWSFKRLDLRAPFLNIDIAPNGSVNLDLAADMMKASEIEKLRAKYHLSKSEDIEPADSENRSEVEGGMQKESYYRAVYDHLVDQIRITDADLENLAKARAEAVIRYLTTAGGLADARIAEKSPESVDGTPDRMIPLKLALTPRS